MVNSTPMKAHKRHPGVDQREHISEHAGGERADILRDALVGIVHPIGIAQPVIGPVEEKPADEDLGHPEPPQEREALGAVAIEDPDGNRRTRKCRDKSRGSGKSPTVSRSLSEVMKFRPA